MEILLVKKPSERKYIYLIRRFSVVSWDIFTSLAVFWRARRASQNTRDEKTVETKA